MKKVTIKDVAKQANVSISTVSRVINNSKPVSDEVKERVKEVIKELGYKPNPIARSLVMKKTNLIGVIVPDIAAFFIGEVLNAIEQIAKIYEYDIILCNSYGEKSQEMKYFNLLKNKHVEGIVFMTYKIDQEHKEFISNSDIPVALINRFSEDLDTLSVSIDHKAAAFEMTEHLIGCGNNKIALLRNGVATDVFINDQLKGYQNALETNGLVYDEALLYNGIFSREQAYEVVEKMIKEDNLPEAIFATSDDIAIASINCLMDHDLSVPEDIQVASFHDTKIANLFRPKLTTIRQPLFDLGSVATRLLIKKINDELESDDEKIKILPHELIIRESSKGSND